MATMVAITALMVGGALWFLSGVFAAIVGAEEGTPIWPTIAFFACGSAAIGFAFLAGVIWP